MTEKRDYLIIKIYELSQCVQYEDISLKISLAKSNESSKICKTTCGQRH